MRRRGEWQRKKVYRCQSLRGHEYIVVFIDLNTSKSSWISKWCCDQQTHFSFLEFKCGIYTVWESLFQECLQIFPFEFVAGNSLLGEVPLGWWRGRNPPYPLLHKACDMFCMLWHDAKAVFKNFK